MRVTILGSGGGVPVPARETACVLVRESERAILLDVGSGARRLLADSDLLEGAADVHVILTHFHFDHVCGLPYLQWLDLDVTIWAPGRWLYRLPSAEILSPLLRPPISPNDLAGIPVLELHPGAQPVGGLVACASAQPHHWAPSVGLRIDDALAYVTDTPYERSSVELARGVRYLLHEAWSASRTARSPDKDATAADAARVAAEAEVGDLVLVHLNPGMADLASLLEDAQPIFDRVVVGEDGMSLA